jgi:predicted nucleic acid-binding Zn ribbon protein
MMMMMITIPQSPYNEVLRNKRRTRGARALCLFSLVPLVFLCFLLSLQLLGFQSPGVRRMSRMAYSEECFLGFSVSRKKEKKKKKKKKLSLLLVVVVVAIGVGLVSDRLFAYMRSG